MKNVLRYNTEDNVLIALEDIQTGEAIRINGETSTIYAACEIKTGHKLAACKISQGQEVRKFNHIIGYAVKDILPGEHVHIHNVRDAAGGWGNKVHHYDPATVKEVDDSFLIKNAPPLSGYRRENGTVGFRNHLLILSTVVCANQPVEQLGKKYSEIITISNPSGCVILPNEVERMKAFLLGLARNPNVGAVIFCGLGCEAIDAQWFYDEIRNEKAAAYVRIQDEGSCENAFEKMEKIALEFKNCLDKQERVPVAISDIRLGTKCGGSDWTTAAVANPAIGYVSDMIVKNGGISMQGETTGWFGAEDFLLAHARSKDIADKIISLMKKTYKKCEMYGRHIEEGNPTPGNIEGGITTLAEKAMGNVKKGGTAPIEGVLEIGEYPKGKHGLYIANNPGLDPISLIGLCSSGANVLIYSTGRGSPVGTPIAPSIKLTASPTALKIFAAHMDVEITDVTFGKSSLEVGAMRLFDMLIETCNGKETIAEINGNREVAFPLEVSPL